MMVLVAYDVTTDDTAGRRRLRHVSKTCKDHGQRVQYSVFECLLEPARWEKLKATLLDIIEPETDSLRFYFLGKNRKNRVEHHGAKPAYDPEGPMII